MINEPTVEAAFRPEHPHDAAVACFPIACFPIAENVAATV